MKKINYSFVRERFFPGYDGKFCKVDPCIAYDGDKTAFMTYSTLLLTGSDVFYDTYCARSSDGGNTFSTPEKLPRLEYYEDGKRNVFCAKLFYNKHHDKWMMIGANLVYADDAHPLMENGRAVKPPKMAFFDPIRATYCSELLDIPFPYEHINATPHMQLIECENGDMLVSYYYTPKGTRASSIVIIRYSLDDAGLHIVSLSEPIVPTAEYRRGYGEPSLAILNGKYYLTIRTDEIGLLSHSDDGVHFTKPTPWMWDDGTVLENYNTMQRWIRHPSGLFLAYTRRGAHNDHIFRHRAPLFMTRFDEDRQCLIRSEEVILVPELGARLGNFSVIEASVNESWLTTAEWMQPAGCEKYGSDNSIWRARIRFE